MALIDIVTAPWALPADKLAELREVYATHMRGEKIDVEALEVRLGRPLASSQEMFAIENGVAVIDVNGVIAPKANLFTRISGGTSAQLLESQVKQAMEDPAISSILLSIDSAGGSVFGVPEVAEAVRIAADTKPVVALGTGTVASGAYWIASAANEIFMSSAVVAMGSIGVVATHIDTSERERREGIRTSEITAGKYKRITSAHSELTTEGREYLQAQVDEIYGVFVETVARNRGVSVDTVLAEMAGGKIFIGKQALSAGLADGVKSRAQLIEEMANGGHARRRVVRAGVAQTIQSTGVLEMSENVKPVTAASIKADHPQVAEALIQEGRQLGIQAGRAEGIEAGAQAERDRLVSIEAATLPGYEAIAAEARADGKTTGPQVAMKIVAAQRAEQSSQLGKIRAQAPAAVAASSPPNTDETLDAAGRTKKASALAAEKKMDFTAAYTQLFGNALA